MSRLPRWAAVTGLQLGAVVPAWSLMASAYGKTEARRFGTGMWLVVFLQQALVGAAALRREPRHQLNLVDFITLTRGLAASLLCGLIASGVRDRRGTAGWMGWLALLYGAIVCDWLDGPIARHRGTSELGAVLDREADSWLTLCAAGGAVAWGEMPRRVALAPILRYVLLFHGLRSRSHARLHGDEPAWVRQVGIAQMLLFIAATAPFRGPVTSRLVEIVAPLQTPVQLAAGLELHRRRMRA